MDFLEGLLVESDFASWIGLHKDGSWNNPKWTDGSLVSFTNWNPGEPDDQGVGHIILIICGISILIPTL